MKAIVNHRYGNLDALELAEIDIPEVAHGTVLVRVHAASVHMGDWHLVTGKPYLLRAMGFGVTAPKAHVRGTDVAGTVEAVGPGVTRLAVGDRVFGSCSGAFAEYASVTEDAVAIVPPGMSFELAAAVPTSGITALQAVRTAGRVEPGQTVLVIGAAGGVGSFAVQIAKSLGAQVTGVCSTAKLELVRSIGADEVIDYTRADITSLGRRYDLIIDTAGNRPLSRLRRILTRRGTLVIVGAETDGRWFGGVERVFRALLISPFLSQKLHPLFATMTKADLDILADLMAAGTVTPIVDRSFPLRDVPAAIQYVHSGQARGKVTITV